MAGLILGMNMLVENLLLIPLLLALMDAASGAGHWRAVVRGAAAGLLRNPMVLGLSAGLLVSLLGLPLPAVADRTVGLFAQASAAVSLFVIGDRYFPMRPRGILADVAPTVLHLLGLPQPEVMTGVSLVALPLEATDGDGVLLKSAQA